MIKSNPLKENIKHSVGNYVDQSLEYYPTKQHVQPLFFDILYRPLDNQFEIKRSIHLIKYSIFSGVKNND